MHISDYYCKNCLHSLKTEHKFKSNKIIIIHHDHCHITMPEEFHNILQYNQRKKSINIPFIIDAVTESLLYKKHKCNSKTKKSLPTKISKHKVFGHSQFTYFSFDTTKNKHNDYTRKDCMKNFVKT